MLTGPSIIVFLHESYFLCIGLKYVALLLLIQWEIIFSLCVYCCNILFSLSLFTNLFSTLQFLSFLVYNFYRNNSTRLFWRIYQRIDFWDFISWKKKLQLESSVTRNVELSFWYLKVNFREITFSWYSKLFKNIPGNFRIFHIFFQSWLPWITSLQYFHKGRKSESIM